MGIDNSALLLHTIKTTIVYMRDWRYGNSGTEMCWVVPVPQRSPL
jgi:hypothetical protein